MADRQVTITIAATDNFSAVMDKYQQEMGQSASATQQASGVFGGFGAVVTGALAALSVQQILQFASGMQQLGDTVNISRAQFGALTQDIGGSTAVLQGLRQATAGVVDDLTLMNASSQLLKTGMISTSAELNQFLGDVEKLKPAGEDLNDAVGTLSQALQTQQTRSLNQFGLNVDAVKAKYEELKAAGEDAAQAFKDAVFQGMATGITKLGDAATAAETPLAKLQTQLSNLAQTASSNFAAGVEGIVNFAEAEVQHAQTVSAFNTQVSQLANRFQQFLQQTQSSSATPMNSPQDMINLQMGVAADAGTGVGMSAGQMQAAAAQTVTIVNQIADAWGKANTQIFTYLQHQNEAAQAAAAAKAAYQPVTDAFNAVNMSPLWGRIYAQAGANMPGGYSDGIPKFLTDPQAANIDNYAKQLEDAATQVKTQFKDIISDDDKNRLDQMVADAKAFADQADKAAKAFDSLKLGDFLGQTSGGVRGQVEDQVLAAAQASGMSKDKLAQLQQTLDLSSGRQTQASLSESQFASSLVGLPPDVVAKAISNWVATMQAAALAGLPSNTFAGNDAAIAGFMPGGAGRQITIKPGDTINGVLAQNPGLTRDQLLAAAGNGRGQILPGNFTAGGPGALNPYYNPQSEVNQIAGIFGSAGQNNPNAPQTTNLNTAITQAHQGMQTIGSDALFLGSKLADSATTLKQMFAERYKLLIALDVIAPDWLKILLQNGGFTAAMAAATKANGGTPPGQQAQGRSTRVIARD